MAEMDMASSDERLELTPAQPDGVREAVAALLGDHSGEIDPWWQAGLDDALADDPI
jgi:hypothetical protein